MTKKTFTSFRYIGEVNLTRSQADTLEALAARRRDPDRSEWAKPCRDIRTLEALERAGFVDLRLRPPFFSGEARITDHGLEQFETREIAV